MIAGRKLLLADDSVAIQKVVDLTFSDEGMEVTTVGDGQDALAKLEHLTPDIVLADIFMPGVDGFELCKFIKRNERLRDVPVMLLVGSFEPFDEADARRAGADDVVTKPFQSIRDLVNRVGSLVSPDDASQQSVLGLRDEQEPAHVAADVEQLDVYATEALTAEEPQVKVFVEAPSMEPDATVLVEAPLMQVEPMQTEHTCPPDIELQTADTQQLESIPAASSNPDARSDFKEDVAVEILDNSEAFTAERMTSSPAMALGDDSVLDLGDIDSFAAPVESDFELELELEPFEASPVNLAAESKPFVDDASADSFSDSATSAVDAETSAPFWVDEPANESPSMNVDAAGEASAKDISAEAIEAISRRVVEQLSDRVVREIAWEVVPELSELLIKKQLGERR